MRLLGNLLWFILGGLLLFLQYVIGGLVLCLTIIGIPFGIQCFKLGFLVLLPFGKEVIDGETAGGLIPLIMNIVWILFGGIWIALSHVIAAMICAITIIGIPFAVQHMKLVTLALTPFGKEIVHQV